MNFNLNKQAHFRHLGLIDYQQAWDLQEKLFAEVVAVKIANRGISPESQAPTPNHLIFCEHPHVFTLGKSGKLENLLLDEEGLNEVQAAFHKINRGGDITYHGPGQLVAYPILDLNRLRLRLHDYLRLLEEIVIDLCSACGIEAHRDPAATGVWIHPIHPGEPDAKICAMGVRIRQWVSMHGLAINVSTNLNHFDLIVPCGLAERRVTSLSNILAEKSPSIERVKSMLAERFQLMVSARLALPDPANQVPPLTQA